MLHDAFRQIAELLPEPMLLVDDHGLIIVANGACVRRLQMPADQMVGRRLHDLVLGPEDEVTRYLRICCRSPQRSPGSLHFANAPDVLWRCEGALLSAGDTAGRLLMLRLIPQAEAVQQFAALNHKIAELSDEIQRRHEAEARLREQRERLRITLDSIGDAVIVTDADARVTMLNPVAQALTGWGPEALGQPLKQVFPIANEFTGQPVDDPVAKVLREGTIVGLANHTVLMSKTGVRHPIADSAAPIRDVQGEVVGVVLVFRDVSEERQAGAALRDSEERLRILYRETQESELRFRQLADSMPQMVWAARPDGYLDYYNRRWYEYIGRPDGVPAGGDRSWAPMLHPDDLRRTMDAWQYSVQTGTAYEIEYRLRQHETGRYCWFLGRALPVRDAAGEIVRWFGTCTEIEGQKRAEQASRFLADASAELAQLRDPESTLRRVTNLAVPDFADWCAVDLVEPDGSLRRLSVAHEDPQKVQLAYELNERYPSDPDAGAGPRHVLRTGVAERVQQIPQDMLRQLARDEHHLQILLDLGLESYLCVPLIVQERVFGVLTFALAESGRRYSAQDQKMAEDLAHRAAIAIDNARLYAELKEADRRKNEFLAMLAHELRNPLAPIRGGLDLLEMEGRDDETLRLMREQVEHLVHLVDDLLDVSRIMRGRISLRKEPVELSQSMHRAVEMTRSLFQTQRHHLEVVLPDQPVWVLGDAVRLTQILINLLNNAAKYTDPGGTISLKARRLNDHVELRVRDNGLGIDGELLPRIFDLFIQADRTLDRSQGGLGIGLTLVRNLVALHGGTVSASSPGIGQGSEFLVTLPVLVDQGEQHRLPQHPCVAAPRRIVVVDDNHGLAMILARLLEKLGNHKVFTAHDGLSALDTIRQHRPEIVFLDIGLPLMDGYEVAQRLRAEGFHRLLLVAMTGYGQDEDRQRSMDAGFDVHMVKPADIRLIAPLLSHAKLQRQEQ